MNEARQLRQELEAKAVAFGDLFDLYAGSILVKPDLRRRAAEILVARAACARGGLPKPDKWPDSDDDLRRYAGIGRSGLRSQTYVGGHGEQRAA